MGETKKTRSVITKVTPLFTKMVCTQDKFDESEAYNEAGLFDSVKLGAVKEVQTIVAINERAESMGLHVGDKVLLDFKRYAVFKDKKDTIKSSFDEYRNTVVRYEFPTLEIGGNEYLLLDTADIIVIINEMVDVPIATKSNLITASEGELKTIIQ